MLVYKMPIGKLRTKLYKKNTDRQAYLHRKSEQPKSLKRRYSIQCNIKLGGLHCKKICQVNTYTTNIKNITYTILYKLNCKSNYMINLMQCIHCHTQYEGKSELQCNIWLNNQNKNVHKQNVHHSQISISNFLIITSTCKLNLR